MYRYLWFQLGVNLKRTTAITINGESSSTSSLAPPPAKYFSRIQNQNSRVVTSTFSSFSTTTSDKTKLTSPDSDSEFIVSYLINSCGLSQGKAITVSKKLKFKTTSNPDSVLTLLRAHGFTESHITKLVTKFPFILSFKPDKTLKPRFDFFKSKGFYGIDLANFISNDPTILRRSLNRSVIPSFGILKSIVKSDECVVKIIKRNCWILGPNEVKKVIVNLELLRNEGVPETNIRTGLSSQPRVYTQSANRFKEIVERVKEMRFHHLQTIFLKAIHGLTSMTEANWRKKMDVYKRWGWSEDHIRTAFRKHPHCMAASEKKIMAVMNFLVNEMGYNTLSISEASKVFCYSFKGRINPRCSVVKILVSKGLIQKDFCINSFITIVDKSFLEKFVTKYEQEVPGLMKVFQCQLNYQDLL
ncbi:uncharacterized protein LOC113321583 [Papaver somniferum]|uniref:uncharacterized protein LOC113321583 n=1 Tax=Papaver somniferum TaxID=3469 RepID=UPI000E6F74AB|nr:uncharacterized protein LOC113321583 [Papaver somniferum]